MKRSPSSDPSLAHGSSGSRRVPHSQGVSWRSCRLVPSSTHIASVAGRGKSRPPYRPRRRSRTALRRRNGPPAATTSRHLHATSSGSSPRATSAPPRTSCPPNGRTSCQTRSESLSERSEPSRGRGLLVQDLDRAGRAQQPVQRPKRRRPARHLHDQSGRIRAVDDGAPPEPCPFRGLQPEQPIRERPALLPARAGLFLYRQRTPPP